jgi:hypothetical protein
MNYYMRGIIRDSPISRDCPMGTPNRNALPIAQSGSRLGNRSYCHVGGSRPVSVALLENLYRSTVEATSRRCRQTSRDILDPFFAVRIVVHIFVENFSFQLHAIVFQICSSGRWIFERKSYLLVQSALNLRHVAAMKLSLVLTRIAHVGRWSLAWHGRPTEQKRILTIALLEMNSLLNKA